MVDSLDDVDDDTAFVPVIDQAHVKWSPSRGAVYVRWFDANKRTWRISPRRPQMGKDVQSEVTRLAAILEKFYEDNHTEPGDIDDHDLGEADADECSDDAYG